MINKNEYYKKLATVSVNNMVMSNTSKCDKCNENLQEFSIFIGEGQRLSTLYSCCCSKCLSDIVKNAIGEGLKDYEKQVKAAEEREYQEALKTVRVKKLNNLEETK